MDASGLAKAAALAGFVASNILMALSFKTALYRAKSTATALALNMASNFIFTVQPTPLRLHLPVRHSLA